MATPLRANSSKMNSFSRSIFTRKPAVTVVTAEEIVITTPAGLIWRAEAADRKAIGPCVICEAVARVPID